jgi:multidrug transporter EmrE-like cation transporter
MEISAPRVVAMFSASIALQFLSVGILPRTNGFTNPYTTVAFLAAMTISFFLIARLIYSGASLGILVPLISALTPFGAVVIGTAIYGEPASFPRLALLTVACGLIGFASRLA